MGDGNNSDRPRRAQSQPGEAVPQWASDEITGVHEGEELRVARARRPTPERLTRLEDKHDSLVRDVQETRADVAEIRGDQKAHGILLREIHDDFKLRRELEQKDQADRKRNTRERWTKAIGWLFSGGVLTYLLHLAGVL